MCRSHQLKYPGVSFHRGLPRAVSGPVVLEAPRTDHQEENRGYAPGLVSEY